MMRTAWILARAALAVVGWRPGGGPGQADSRQTSAPVNLVPNGDFEAGDATPTGWQTVDGLTHLLGQGRRPQARQGHQVRHRRLPDARATTGG